MPENFDSPTAQTTPYSKLEDKFTVATPSAAYDEMMEKWELPVDLMGGTLKMRSKGTKWLPQEPKESYGAYENRLSRTVLFNAYRRTVQVLSGLPFNRAVVVDDVPDQLSYLTEDCDNNGTDLTDFSQKLLEDCINFGMSFIYPDMPSVEGTITLAEREQHKIRPYFIHISPLNLISVESEKIGGVEVLTRLRIKEQTTVPVGEWGQVEQEQIRVIYPDRHEIYVEVEKGKWELQEEIPYELGYIPLIVVYGNKTGFMTAEPALEDLAWLNLKHYQKVSDLDNIEHVANVPIMFGSGFPEGALQGTEIGPNRAISSEDPNASLTYVEHSGAAIGASQKSVKDLEERMAAMGSDLIVRKSVDRQTAAARKIDQSESISLLQIMVNNTETGIEQAYAIAGDWLGIETDVVVTIADNMDTDTGAPNWIDIVTQYLLENKGITVEQAVVELKRRGVLSDRFKLVEPDETSVQNSPQGDTQEEEDSSEQEA